MAKPGTTKQVVGSLVAAAIVTAAAIAAVTAKIGPGLDAVELRERRELLEEQNEAREDRIEESQEAS